MAIIRVENDGAVLAASDYWGSEYAREGKCYLSTNAGCFRLLVPGLVDAGGPQKLSADALVREMATGEYVVVTRGPWMGRSEALELLFEDGTDAPFSLHVVAAACDRLPAAGDEGRTDLAFAAYLEGPRRVLELPARYRRVSQELPCLKPWGGA